MTCLLEAKDSDKPTIELSEIHRILLSIGIPPNLLGYSYILSALELIMPNPIYLHTITKGLYVDIAKKYNVTPGSVERAIRHAINTGWRFGNYRYINHIFKNCVSEEKASPSNSVFLSVLYYSCNSMKC